MPYCGHSLALTLDTFVIRFRWVANFIYLPWVRGRFLSFFSISVLVTYVIIIRNALLSGGCQALWSTETFEKTKYDFPTKYYLLVMNGNESSLFWKCWWSNNHCRNSDCSAQLPSSFQEISVQALFGGTSQLIEIQDGEKLNSKT